MAQELKDYDIMDIEAMDDERLEKSPSGRIFVTRVYIKDEMDAVLAEKDKDIAYWRKEYDEETELTDALKAEIESLNASHYAEIRRLKRALYKACANWARSERYTEATWHGDKHREELWANVQTKCRAKAEEYK